MMRSLSYWNCVQTTTRSAASAQCSTIQSSFSESTGTMFTAPPPASQSSALTGANPAVICRSFIICERAFTALTALGFAPSVPRITAAILSRMSA